MDAKNLLLLFFLVTVLCVFVFSVCVVLFVAVVVVCVWFIFYFLHAYPLH